MLHSSHKTLITSTISDAEFLVYSMPSAFSYGWAISSVLDDRTHPVASQTLGRSSTDISNPAVLNYESLDFISMSCSTKVCLGVNDANQVYSWGDKGNTSKSIGVLGRDTTFTPGNTPELLISLLVFKSRMCLPLVWVFGPRTRM